VTRIRAVEFGDDLGGGPELQVAYTVPAPTKAPTKAPTTTPTKAPTTTPTTVPTKAPTTAPTTVPTTAPTTVPATVPVTTQPTPAPTATTPPVCVTDALLVPSCGVLWGAAAGGFTATPRDQALVNWEAVTGRTATIFHTYHRGDETFPTQAEIAMTQDAAHPRVLLLNWRVDYGSTWAAVAAGEKDARIDNWAAYLKANYDGVTNVVNVLAYMGNERWMAQSWWKDLYPGDDVVDWVGLDSYVSVERGYYHFGDFGDLLDRKPTGSRSWRPSGACTTGSPTRPARPPRSPPCCRSSRGTRR
jgi:hypothetical protein